MEVVAADRASRTAEQQSHAKEGLSQALNSASPPAFAEALQRVPVVSPCLGSMSVWSTMQFRKKCFMNATAARAHKGEKPADDPELQAFQLSVKT